MIWVYNKGAVMSLKKVSNIIEALGKHEDNDSVRVLCELGTNHANDEVRELTARALIKRNSKESLEIVIKDKGKGINDLSARVAMTAINELLALKEKERAIEILEETLANSETEQEVQDTARSVKALMSFSS